MEINYESRIVALEKDVSYLKDGHNEMKAIIKNLEGLPYDIRSVNIKLDTVIEQQREIKADVKEEIASIEERLDCLEDGEETSPSKSNNLLDSLSPYIKWAVFIGMIIAAIIGAIKDIPIPVVGN